MTVTYGNNPVQQGFILFNFDTTDILTGIPWVTIPAGSRILRMCVHVLTVFNATNTNNINVGLTPGGLEAAVNFPVTAVGEFPLFSHFTNISTQSPLNLTRTFYVKYMGSGAAVATTGKAVLTVLYARYHG